MQYRSQIQSWLKDHESEMLTDLGELIAVPSVRGKAQMSAPYGEYPAAALRLMLEKCEKYGFRTENVDFRAGCIDLDGKSAKLGILAHLDVVPAGEGWIHKPFEMTEEDGRLIGRGTSDDKGPAIAALYAMRAVKELGIPLQSGVQLIVGTDEECGSSDLEYYMQKKTLPPMVFTPDGDYPVITLEKGMARMEFSAQFEERGQIVSLRAGEVVNAVPAFAEAVLEGITIDEFLASRKTEYPGMSIGSFVDQYDCLHITIDGRSAHASTPEQGRNALTCLLELLSCVLGENAQAEAIRTLAKCFPHGETDGTHCNVRASDEISGALTLVLSVMEMDRKYLTAKCDTRFPTCTNGKAVTEGIAAAVRPLRTEVLMCDEPHHTDENSPFVQTLLHIYEEVTGNEGKCLAIGGGTYVHHIEGGVAFGAMFPDEDIHMHGAEEFIRKEAILLDSEMMALAITELCAEN
ncbi:MAG: Sapep family Mn(2+)-dependent dipeptidase [Oscillospiraceae bacterium]|nr:Sapep family Mn(2+)-dependent dipeptidase [Oscillospiraceae bacterium]